MKHKNRRLLDLCHDLPCTADFEHSCKGQVVPCHANDLLFGHGMGCKAPDHFIAAMCKSAHDVVDGRSGGWGKEEKRYAWLRAYVRTQNLLWNTGRIKIV